MLGSSRPYQDQAGAGQRVRVPRESIKADACLIKGIVLKDPKVSRRLTFPSADPGAEEVI